MASEKNIIRLEKDIISKIMQIRSGKVLPQDSGIGKSINLMKAIDEPLYDKLMAEYKKILKNINK